MNTDNLNVLELKTVYRDNPRSESFVSKQKQLNKLQLVGVFSLKIHIPSVLNRYRVDNKLLFVK